MADLKSIKVVLLGDSGVGKTTIVTQYVSGAAPESVNPTIGAAFLTKELTIDGQNLELLIWDTAGQEVYRGLAPMYYRSAVIGIIVFDVTNADSHSAVSYWVQQLQENIEGGIVILVCGNKVDLEDKRVIEFQAASNGATREGALYAETSGQTGTGVDRMFELAVSTYLKNMAPKVSNGPVNIDLTAKPASDAGESGCC
jgi:Rab family protein